MEWSGDAHFFKIKLVFNLIRQLLQTNKNMRQLPPPKLPQVFLNVAFMQMQNMVYWLIDCCITSIGKYFVHTQDENKLSNNKS